MVYVERNDGTVVGVYANRQPGFAEEELPYDHAEVVAFLNPPPTAQPVALCQVAGARLLVDQDSWEVTGIERSTGIAGAFLVDTDLVYVFFTADAVQPDTIYDVIPREGVTKHEDYVEVARPGLTELNFIVQRVQ